MPAGCANRAGELARTAELLLDDVDDVLRQGALVEAEQTRILVRRDHDQADRGVEATQRVRDVDAVRALAEVEIEQRDVGRNLPRHAHGFGCGRNVRDDLAAEQPHRTDEAHAREVVVIDDQHTRSPTALQPRPRIRCAHGSTVPQRQRTANRSRGASTPSSVCPCGSGTPDDGSSHSGTLRHRTLRRDAAKSPTPRVRVASQRHHRRGGVRVRTRAADAG